MKKAILKALVMGYRTGKLNSEETYTVREELCSIFEKEFGCQPVLTPYMFDFIDEGKATFTAETIKFLKDMKVERALVSFMASLEKLGFKYKIKENYEEVGAGIIKARKFLSVEFVKQ